MLTGTNETGVKHCERILLTGFRATGKSAVGRIVAELLSYRFLDTDSLLADLFGCSVGEYVGRAGWQTFRERERELLAELARETRVVIATGGGAILHRDEWNALRHAGLSVWLQADAATIRRRLREDDGTAAGRPPLQGGSTIAEVERVLAEREPLYRDGSDLQVETAGRSPEEIAAEIRDVCIRRQNA